MNERKNIEFSLRRRTAADPQRITALHEASANEQWWVRCWNCKEQNTARPAELKTCFNCGRNLWSRDEARS